MKYILLSLILLVSLTVHSQVISGIWFGELSAGQTKLNVVFNISKDNSGTNICTLDSPDQGIKNIPAKITLISEDSIKIDIPSLGASYKGAIAKNLITGNFSQSGFNFDLNLKQGKPEVKRPQTPQPPFEYLTEEISFKNEKDNAILSGTLTYPIGYEKMKKESVPVVIMISGSGLQNRDEELFDHKPFLIIADYLAKNGIASLRYDDRSVGKSTGDATNATTVNFMEDAAAGLEFLKKIKKFGKTGVIGHSEGGTISFMLGADKKADFIISLAGTAVRGDSILVEQTRIALMQAGMPEALCNDYCKVLDMAYKYKISGKEQNNPVAVIDEIIKNTHADIPEEAKKNLVSVLSLKNHWLDFFMGYDPSKNISATTCPVMALNGSLDTQVISATNLNTIKKLLPKNKKNLVNEYKGLNHLFQICTTGSATEYGRIEETISTEVLKNMADWIKSL